MSKQNMSKWVWDASALTGTIFVLAGLWVLCPAWSAVFLGAVLLAVGILGALQ